MREPVTLRLPFSYGSKRIMYMMGYRADTISPTDLILLILERYIPPVPTGNDQSENVWLWDPGGPEREKLDDPPSGCRVQSEGWGSIEMPLLLS